MSVILTPIVFSLFVWWFSTGLVLYAVGMPRRTLPWTMLVTTVSALAAIYALIVSANDTTVQGAFIAFTAAIVIWGWHEMTFLTGLLTGPRTTEHPSRKSGRAHFWPAVETLLYHEFAILLTAALAIGLLVDAPNQTGLWTFLILWAMRLSAKLNVYFGVPNLTEEFLPDHLIYLKSYFCRRPMNGFFPLSVTASTVVATLLVQQIATAASAFEVSSMTLLSTLMVLAVLEHWFLVLPLPAGQLWTWGLKSRDAAAADVTA